jgi:hypothetical protein
MLRQAPIPTIWKYNSRYHITEHHVDANGSPPSLPPSMAVSTFISQEEAALSIEKMRTYGYRSYLDVSGSDDVKDIDERLKREYSPPIRSSKQGQKETKKEVKLCICTLVYV